MLTTATPAVFASPQPRPNGQLTEPTSTTSHPATSTGAPLVPVTPGSVAPLAVAATAPGTDIGLVNLRTMVILALAFFIAMTIGTAAGLAAAYTASHAAVALGLTAGLAAFFTSFLASAATLHSLISR